MWPWQKKDRYLLRNNHIRNPDGNHFPVVLPLDADYDAVLEETVSQIEEMGRLFEKHAE